MKTYEELKNTNDLKVKDWFNCSISYPFFAAENWRTEFMIVKETEKAVCINIDVYLANGDNYTRDVWVPKKCFESYEEYKEREAKAEERYEAACSRYDELVAFCKANGIKGARSGMRKDTLLAKVSAAGLAFVW